MNTARRQKIVLAILTALSAIILLTNVTYTNTRSQLIRISLGSDRDMDLLNLQDAARELDVEDRITQFFNSSGVIISGKNVEQRLDAKLKVCHLSCLFMTHDVL